MLVFPLMRLQHLLRRRRTTILPLELKFRCIHFVCSMHVCTFTLKSDFNSCPDLVWLVPLVCAWLTYTSSISRHKERVIEDDHVMSINILSCKKRTVQMQAYIDQHTLCYIITETYQKHDSNKILKGPLSCRLQQQGFPLPRWRMPTAFIIYSFEETFK